MVVLNLDNSETRRIVENCYRTQKTLINPLIDWDDDFLYWYIRNENIDLNPLYGCGWGRVGCIGCPLAGKHRWREFERYPKYRDAYIRAFERMLEERKRRGLKTMEMWSTGKKVFKWWMEDENLDGQLAFDLDGKRWNCSKNLVRPEPEIRIISDRAWFKSEPTAIKGYYVDKDSVSKGVHSPEYYGYGYMRYTLVKLE